MKTPKRPGEWQEAADAAHGALVLDAARQYGLVTGGPVVNVARAEDLLARAKALGYVPRPEAVEMFIAGLAKNFTGGKG